MITYYLTDLPFSGWIDVINHYTLLNNHIKYIENIDDIDDIDNNDENIDDINNDENIDDNNDTNVHKKNNYKLIPLSVPHCEMNYDPNNLFTCDLEGVDILNNKVLFAKFMMKFYPDFIPETFYYSWGGIWYNSGRNHMKMIKKPAFGSSGKDILIVGEIDEDEEGVVVSKYIQHTRYYAGHFIVKKGVILNRVYFYTDNNDANFIKRGAIQDYSVMRDLGSDGEDRIFENIFMDLGYSGFAHSDFVIVDGRVVIFEIGPRAGGSLISAFVYFGEFLDSIFENW